MIKNQIDTEIDVLDTLFELQFSNELPKEFCININALNDIVLIRTNPKWEKIREDKTNKYQIGFLVDNSYDALENLVYDMDELLQILSKNGFSGALIN